MKFENFIAFIIRKLFDAKALIILKNDGTWDLNGIPNNLFPQNIVDEFNLSEDKKQSFIEKHNEIEDSREDAWWIV